MTLRLEAQTNSACTKETASSSSNEMTTLVNGWYLGKHLQNGRTGLFPEGKSTTAVEISNKAHATH